MEVDVGSARVTAAAAVGGSSQISQRGAGAHRGEPGRAQLGLPVGALRSPRFDLFGVASLLLRGGWQELASARWVHGHGHKDGRCRGSTHPVSTHIVGYLATDFGCQGSYNIAQHCDPTGAGQFIEHSLEELIARDPEVLILQYDFADGDGPAKTVEQARQEFLALPGVREMQTVRDGTVVGVPVGETAADPLAVDGLGTLDQALSVLR